MSKKRINRITNILLFVILLIGMSLLLYPTVADWWNQFHQTRAIASYEEAVSSIDPAVYEQMFADARVYNESLWGKENRYLQSQEDHEWYESLLDVTGTGIMGYIRVPKINVYLPIYHGVTDVVLQVAAGHIEGTSLPIGGMGTHSVISGHRGLPSAKLFTDLDQLSEGDIFTLTVLNQTITYEVDQIRIVLPVEVDGLTIDLDQDYTTLVTCTPYGINSHRMLVRGHRIDNLEEEIQVTEDATLFKPLEVAPVIAGPILLFLVFFILIKDRPRKSLEQIKRERLSQRPQKEDSETSAEASAEPLAKEMPAGEAPKKETPAEQTDKSPVDDAGAKPIEPPANP